MNTPETQSHSPAAESHCSATGDELIIAFVQGAKWWEYLKTGATMWPSDRDQAELEAKIRAADGTLGKSPHSNPTRKSVV